MKYLILTISVLFIFSSCTNDFLEKPPTKNGVIPTKVSDLQKSYEGGIQYNTNNYFMLITDDCTLPFTEFDITSNTGYAKYINQFFPILFQRDIMSRSIAYGSKAVWQKYYSKVYNDNYVLSMADSDLLNGSKEERKTVKSFARFDRAVAMFQLATTYCQPWAPGKNDNELGLVLKNEYTLAFNEDNLGRKSLKETYEFIEKDLLASFDIPNTNENWRYTLKAVYAFSARFYLTIGNYSEALKYANLALQINNTLEDYTTYTRRTINIRNVNVQIIEQVFDKIATDQYSIRDLKSEYLIELMQAPFNAFIPSQELLDLYNGQTGEQDVRNWFFPTNGLGASGLFRKPTATATAAYPFYYGYYYGSFMTTFPNVAEVMLIKAECLVRENNNLAEAKALLHQLRMNRIKNYNPVTVNNLTSRDEVLNFIYAERRREKPFLLRGLDMRRLHALEGKPLNVKRDFYELDESKIIIPVVPKQYVLTEADLALKLFEGDITLSNGYLEQNP